MLERFDRPAWRVRCDGCGRVASGVGLGWAIEADARREAITPPNAFAHYPRAETYRGRAVHDLCEVCAADHEAVLAEAHLVGGPGERI